MATKNTIVLPVSSGVAFFPASDAVWDAPNGRFVAKRATVVSKSEDSDFRSRKEPVAYSIFPCIFNDLHLNIIHTF